MSALEPAAYLGCDEADSRSYRRYSGDCMITTQGRSSLVSLRCTGLRSMMAKKVTYRHERVAPLMTRRVQCCVLG
jgi:hypothetical protein